MNDPEGRSSAPDNPVTNDDAGLDARLAALSERLADRQNGSDNDHRGARRTDAQGYGLGLRVATDIVAGTLLGGGLGWLADSLLGTSPWGLIVLLMFGVAAGVLLALRSAGLVKEPTIESQSRKTKGE